MRSINSLAWTSFGFVVVVTHLIAPSNLRQIFEPWVGSQRPSIQPGNHTVGFPKTKLQTDRVFESRPIRTGLLKVDGFCSFHCNAAPFRFGVFLNRSSLASTASTFRCARFESRVLPTFWNRCKVRFHLVGSLRVLGFFVYAFHALMKLRFLVYQHFGNSPSGKWPNQGFSV